MPVLAHLAHQRSLCYSVNQIATYEFVCTYTSERLMHDVLSVICDTTETKRIRRRQGNHPDSRPHDAQLVSIQTALVEAQQLQTW
jgi:hypothetical protein